MNIRANRKPRSTLTHESAASEKLLRVRMRAIEMPPIKDALVIGTDAAIGGEAMARTLRLMTNEKFERIPLKDDVVAEVVIRLALLRKIGKDHLLSFVMRRVKPLMTESELLLLDIDVELAIDHSF